MRITAVTCVKNEGPFLLEWIAYQRLIGVSDFLFYSNDCSDGTDHLLDALQARGLVRHLPNPAQDHKYQMQALKAALEEPEITQADWIWVADVDEFLNIHVGDHTLASLIGACGGAQAISVCFQFFANDGVADFEDRPVIAQFARSHNPDMHNDTPQIEVKTLFSREFPLRYIGAHRPFARPGELDQIRWYDGGGRLVSGAFVEGQGQPAQMRRLPAMGGRTLATLNHYALRSLESYLVKHDRGDVNRPNRRLECDYWRDRNDPAWQDLSIQRHLPALEREIAALRADPEIEALHQACVAAHQAKITALLAQPAYQELANQLRATPPLPRQEAALIERLGLLP